MLESCNAVFRSYKPNQVLKIPVVKVCIAKCSTAPKSDKVSIITKARPAIIAGLTKGTANLLNRDLLSKPSILPASIRLLD